MTGSCLCGEIEFEADEIPGEVFNCHCSRCRKAHGAAFATQAFAVRSTLKFRKGEELLKEYDSSPHGIRAFCSNCGSRLMNYQKNNGPYLSIAIACLDESYRGKPKAHAFVASKAHWHEPSAGIPAFDDLPR
jgi:hypothetical protein